MNQLESNRELTSYILKKPYVLVSELETKFNLVTEDVFKYVETVQDKLDELGLKIEIIEVNERDYCLIYQQDTSKDIPDVVLGLLTILAVLSKKRGGYLTQKIIDEISKFYDKEIKYLEIEHFIEKNKTGLWSISPLGILSVFPVLKESESLINSNVD